MTPQTSFRKENGRTFGSARFLPDGAGQRVEKTRSDDPQIDNLKLGPDPGRIEAVN